MDCPLFKVLFWVAWVILVPLRSRSALGGFQWLVVWRWDEGPRWAWTPFALEPLGVACFL